tara:strand:+ start:396 stop:578 length:183 start_codon:yes stop_codon:yes gene_type:complete
MIYKNLHDIHTHASSGNETTLVGTDENGDEFTITLSTFELLEWLDVEYMKDTLIKHIKTI